MTKEQKLQEAATNFVIDNTTDMGVGHRYSHDEVVDLANNFATSPAAQEYWQDKLLDEIITKIFWQRKSEFIRELNSGYDTWKEFNDNIRFYISRIILSPPKTETP